MFNFLVTGGAGFIGSNFLNLFIKKVNFKKIIILDKLTYAGNLKNINHLINNSNIRFIKGDICDKKIIPNILKKYSIEVIFNFAAESHVDNSIKASNIFINTNINGTHNLITAAKNYWKSDYKNKLFFQISTDEVFGHLNKNQKKFSEESKYNPRSPYSASKASADMLVKAFYHTFKIPFVITHCANNYGPNQHIEKLIPKTITNLQLKKSIPVYGDGKNIRNWIYVEDHCEAIIKIFKRKYFNTTFNIGGNNQINNINLVRSICREYDKLNNISNSIQIKSSSQNLIMFVKDRLGHDFRYDINTSKIEKLLSYKSKIKLKDGIIMTLKWYLSKKNKY